MPMRGSAASDWNQASSWRSDVDVRLLGGHAAAAALDPVEDRLELVEVAREREDRLGRALPDDDHRLVVPLEALREEPPEGVEELAPPVRVGELEAVDEEDDAPLRPGLGGGGAAAPPRRAVPRRLGIGSTLTAGKAVPRTSWKFVTLMSLPSCRTSKSSAFRPWTASPAASVTTTSRLNSVSSAEAVTRGASAPAAAAERPAQEEGGEEQAGRLLHVPRRDALRVPRGVVACRIRWRPMISFASLFVGLVFGIVNVQLVAAAGVDRVDLFLDGSRVAELREPFRAPVDLGCDPAPHELVAVARDARGKEVGRVRQWVNRPRANAEAALVLEPGRGDRGRIARLTWRCLTAENPRVGRGDVRRASRSR